MKSAKSTKPTSHDSVNPELLARTQKLSHEQFTIQSIHNLRDKGYKGIDPVISGFNTMFRQVYGIDPIPVTKQLAKDGKLVIRPKKGGVIFFDPAEEGVKPSPTSDDLLKKILS